MRGSFFLDCLFLESTYFGNDGPIWACGGLGVWPEYAKVYGSRVSFFLDGLFLESTYFGNDGPIWASGGLGVEPEYAKEHAGYMAGGLAAAEVGPGLAGSFA